MAILPIPGNRPRTTPTTPAPTAEELAKATEALVVRAFGLRSHQVAYLHHRGWRERLGRGGEKLFSHAGFYDGREVDFYTAVTCQIRYDAQPFTLQVLGVLEEVPINPQL